LLEGPRAAGRTFGRHHRAGNQQPQRARGAALQKRWDRLRGGLDLILQQRGADMIDLPGGASGLLARDYKGSASGVSATISVSAGGPRRRCVRSTWEDVQF
jgi:hypothetical protein